MKFDDELESQVQALLNSEENRYIFTKPHPTKYVGEASVRNYYLKKQKIFKSRFYEIRNHFDPKLIFLELRDDKKENILRQTEMKPLFGLNVKMFAYPENFFVLWVGLSIIYSQ